MNPNRHYRSLIENTFTFEKFTTIEELIEKKPAFIIGSQEPLIKYLFSNKCLELIEKVRIFESLKKSHYLVSEKELVFLLKDYAQDEPSHQHKNTMFHSYLLKEHQEKILNLKHGATQNNALNLIFQRFSSSFEYTSLLDYYWNIAQNHQHPPSMTGKNGIHYLALNKMSGLNKRKNFNELIKDPNNSINAQTKQGNTLLHLALIKQNNPDFIDFLLNEGADLTIKNKFGITAFDLYQNYFEKVLFNYRNVSKEQIEFIESIRQKFEMKHFNYIVKDVRQHKKQKI